MTGNLAMRIDNIKQRLSQGSMNEEATKQGCVLPVFSELGWNVFDSAGCFRPEFTIGTGRVDYALFGDGQEPLALIEVKRPGQGDKGIEQILEYAFKHGGVGLLLVVDGNSWRFFLANAPGSFLERCALTLSVLDTPNEELVDILPPILSREAMMSGESMVKLRGHLDRTKASAKFNSVWGNFIETDEAQGLLATAFSSAVEEATGVKPSMLDVRSFVKRRTIEGDEVKGRQGGTRRGTLIVGGNATSCSSKREAFVQLLQKLHGKNPIDFLRNFSAKCVYVVNGADENAKRVTEITRGWYLTGSHNSAVLDDWMRIAAETAGMKWGQDVRFVLNGAGS